MSTFLLGPRLGAVLVAAAALTLAFALPQAALAGQGPPGNNGDIKIHSASTPQADQRNEPQPDCPFYISFFNFDANDQVDFIINLGPPHPNNPTPPYEFLGSVTTDASGNARSVDISLPDGAYKAYAVEEGAVGQGAKQKVFTVDCPGGPAVTPTPTPTPTPTSTPDGGGSTPTPTPTGGGGDDGDVGGVGTPPGDDDDGPTPVGGVATGGGGMTGVAAVDVTVPAALTAAAGLAVVAASLRRRPE